ncbi:MAG: beta galactosidase jelly roll domain-containing protein [Bacteroidota bacterium]|nr:beta galactosidase jelly roll domain-containing protein [Bacteroidota bacterium]
MRNMKVHFLLLGLLFCAPSFLTAQSHDVKQIALTNFNLQSSYVITETGKELSTSAYNSRVYWFPVKVPSTVLTGLVANKVYPDPYIGMNNMLIPDASDSFNHQYNLEQYSYLPNEPNPWKKPYWYRTTFTVPKSDKGKHFQLIFKGINYRAAVWVNGKQIADSSQMAGMFAQYSLDVTNTIHAGETNVLAVKIYPLDYPGLPATPQLKALGDFFANGGPTGDIGKNVTMLCSVGWDWMPAVRDRNMGIWQPVYLRTSGQVVIQNPHIKTELPNLPDTNIAHLSLDLSLNNYGAEKQNGNLKITISPENFSGPSFTVNQKISIDANGSADVHLSPQNVKQFTIQKPHLWWPNGYGQPNLYRIRLQYQNGNQISDDTSFVLGIRTVSSKVVMVNGWARRDFYVNAERIHLDGGAWVPDMMLNRDSARYDYELHLCRNANINLVRIWGGGIAPPDIFFDMADKYGLLVWQDFWVTGDTQGEFKGSPDWPLEGNVFIRNMESTIYRIRNHASLLLWTGGNEGHARKELYDAMRNDVATLDGTRPFIPSSSGFAKLPTGWKGSWPDDQPSGVYSGGPYSWQDAAHYYKLADAGRDWVFKDETGIPSQPPYETLPAIINNLVPDSTLPFPLNNTWGYHDACVGNGHYDTYYNAMAERYGAPESMKDFSDKMQLVNADGYRGIFEAAGHKLNETGGVMLWKLNAALPSVIWQVYDWYLNPNAGYYFMKRACEPVHIQLNLDDSVVAIVNRSYKSQVGLKAEVKVYDLNSKLLFSQNKAMSLKASDVKESISLQNVLAKENGVSFVVLSLKNATGKTISQNTYWFAPDHNFKVLKEMPAAEVKVKVIKTEKLKNETKWTLQISNTNKGLAFFINPQIIENGKEILPSFWSDNYFSLSPNESTTVTVSIPNAKIAIGKTQLAVSGWNVEKKIIPLGIANN